MAGAGSNRFSPAESECHGIGPPWTARSALGTGGPLQGYRRGRRYSSPSIRIINRARAGNSRKTQEPPWCFTGIIAIGKFAPRAESSACRTPRMMPISPPAPGRAGWALGQPAKRARRFARRPRPSDRNGGRAPWNCVQRAGLSEPESVTTPIARPPEWGGFRLEVDAVELWVEGEFRIHDRARWTKTAAQWSVTRLQP